MTIQDQQQKRKREEAAKQHEEIDQERADTLRVQRRMKIQEQWKAGNVRAQAMAVKHQILLRKADLCAGARVMGWKSQQLVSPPDEEATDVDLMMRSAKRGLEHDLCEECAQTLKFCSHEGCSIIGCTKCFHELSGCPSCQIVICEEHADDWNQCANCDIFVCVPCYGQKCGQCKNFICLDCESCKLCGDRRLSDDDYDDSE